MQLNEDSLKAGDLVNLVDHIFEIDSHASKMGDDRDVVVLSFTVEGKPPAEDLVNFLEKGYQFVLDADVTPGELSDGKYRVFVEIERNKEIANHIADLLYGVEKLSAISNFKFRYYKGFNSIDATKDNLAAEIPSDPLTYDDRIEQKKMESYQTFFSKTMVENISFNGRTLEFKKIYAGPLKFKFISAGDVQAVLESIEDRIAVSMHDMADVMFLTKYIGNYNITKLGNRYMFENNGYAVLLEKL